MKQYNINLDMLGDIPEQYNNLFQSQVQFLSNLVGNKPELVETMKERVDNTMLILCSRGENGRVVRPSLYNGKMYKFEMGNAGACVANTVQMQHEDGWKFMTGVNIRGGAYDINNPSTYRSTLPHEFFHALSKNISSTFDSNGICYTKSGFKITKYDRQDNEIENKGSDGLTEGVTEMLANMFNNTIQNPAYSFPTFIARILHCAKHKGPSLLEAYVSKDEKTVETFFENFGKFQNIIPADTLASITTSENAWFDENNFKTIEACLQYTINSLNTVPELQAFYDSVKQFTINIACRQRQSMGQKVHDMLVPKLNARKQAILAIEEASM